MTNDMKLSQTISASGARPKKRKIASLDRRKARAGWFFVLPFIIGISVVIYGVSTFFSGKGGLFSKIFAGIIAIYGVSLVLNPFKGATSITSMVGFGLLVFGIIKIVKWTLF